MKVVPGFFTVVDIWRAFTQTDSSSTSDVYHPSRCCTVAYGIDTLSDLIADLMYDEDPDEAYNLIVIEGKESGIVYHGPFPFDPNILCVPYLKAESIIEI